MMHHNRSFWWAILHTSCVLVLCISVCVCLIFVMRPVYAWSIQLNHLTVHTGLSENQLLHNYDVLLHYLFHPFHSTLAFPDFASSAAGLQHFHEVKQLLWFNNGCGVVAGVMLLWLVKRAGRQPELLYRHHVTRQAVWLPAIPLVLLSLVALDFENFFIWFHKLLFRNDHWLFNPLTDPIINALPATFFLTCFVVTFVLLESLLVGYAIWTRRRLRTHNKASSYEH